MKRVVGLALAVILLLGSAAAQEIPDPTDDILCIFHAPDLSICALGAATGGRNGVLAEIACVMDTINDWQHQQLDCLEKRIYRRTNKVIYPAREVLKELDMTLQEVKTIREEAEALACDWKFSVRSDLLKGIYLKQVRLCKDSYGSIFGQHDKFWNAPFAELAAWTSVNSKNLIQTRTGGELDMGPEATWRATAEGVSKWSLETEDSPGRAVRYSAMSRADSLRVKANTIDLQAQRLLVQELLSGRRMRKRSNEEAAARYLTLSVAGWGDSSGLTGRLAGPLAGQR